MRHLHISRYTFSKGSNNIFPLKLTQLCLNHFVFKRVIAYHLVLAAILGNMLNQIMKIYRNVQWVPKDGAQTSSVGSKCCKLYIWLLNVAPMCTRYFDSDSQFKYVVYGRQLVSNCFFEQKQVYFFLFTSF